LNTRQAPREISRKTNLIVSSTDRPVRCSPSDVRSVSMRRPVARL